MRNLVRLAAAVTVLATPSLAGAAPLSASSRIGPAGVGPIVFGVTPADVRAAGAAFDATSPAPGSSCFYLHPRGIAGLAFLIESGTVRRAEVTTTGVATVEGVRVGDAETSVRRHFGARAHTRPGKYDPRTHELEIEPVDPAVPGRLVFVVRGGTVVAIRSGLPPQIFYVEGCS